MAGLGVLSVVIALAYVMASPVAKASAQPQGHGRARMVITLFMDGGHGELYTPATTPTIAGLAAHGVEYTHARSGVPSDSFPGLLDSFTGNDPTRTGIPYEVFYDRSYPSTINLTEHPSYPGYPGTPPWNFVRKPTVFDSVHNAGLRTAFIASQHTYSVLNGPSGNGIDNLKTPTLSFHCGSLDYRCAERFDNTNFHSLIKEVTGPTPPALSGLYVMAPNQAMKAGGIHNAAGTGPSAITAQALAYEDHEVAGLIAALKKAHRWQHTVLIVTADHGNNPIRPNPYPNCAQNDASAPNACPFIDPSTIDSYLGGHGIPVAHDTADDVALLWLKHPDQATRALKLLNSPTARNRFAVSRLLTRKDLAALGAAPANRTPDLAISPRTGFDYDSVNSTKRAEHGGFHPGDRGIPLIVGGAVPHAGRVISTPVTNLQVAPTIASLLRVPFPSSEVPPLPGLTPGR
ncbi:MAG TPA: alkaline phosphatase family protein [Acidimicrobiales bacterium]|nr:alkaline phosphatase family protein [Acidimicrobiales bacterium]